MRVRPLCRGGWVQGPGLRSWERMCGGLGNGLGRVLHTSSLKAVPCLAASNVQPSSNEYCHGLYLSSHSYNLKLP